MSICTISLDIFHYSTSIPRNIKYVTIWSSETDSQRRVDKNFANNQKLFIYRCQFTQFQPFNSFCFGIIFSFSLKYNIILLDKPLIIWLTDVIHLDNETPLLKMTQQRISTCTFFPNSKPKFSNQISDKVFLCAKVSKSVWTFPKIISKYTNF